MSNLCFAGPLVHATLIVADVQAMSLAYGILGLERREAAPVSAAQAQAWGQPDLQGCAQSWLAPVGAPTLLRLIEQPGAPRRPTRLSHGWLALEILVRDVDALAARFEGSAFEIVGPPADLAINPNIRAMQVVGPAGEMLYLTEVKAAVPPFQLPMSAALPASQALGPLFIAVLSTPSRPAAIAACAALCPLATLQFDTRVTVLGRALGKPLDHPWPVATLQWRGNSLFEIDEVVDEAVATPAAGVLGPGLAWITMRASATPTAHAALQELSPGAWLELVPD